MRNGFGDGSATSYDALPEGHAVDELHDQKRIARVLFDAVERRDTGMIERREQLGFALEPGEPFGVTRDIIGQNFDRDVSTELGVVRAIDFTHATLADGLDDFVGTESGSCSECHFDYQSAKGRA